ncbi:DUF411 domain-containing protein [Oculatella sp. FACHB-28]|uniref:DUF411 domain-containing protein n=1 Tax=Oculatella sp. FACHB-28 TaxID=2692845 RepID=UPI001689A911|nr:DUF411 domain-containing protein [Oculatella sp. FACHB-28]MBD1866252.1 DUF411 domain-containing protein [Cyanobacteria bacterium FACHB-471]MBD2056308.1 DUF411 domain-containing protein [Oculatella sp. FACHB-28]
MIKVIGSQIYQYVKLVVVCWMAIATVIVLTTASAEAASTPEVMSEAMPEIVVYRDPSCSCCGGWMEHLEAQGFQATNMPTPEVDALKQQYGIPDDLTSCHTAIIGGYVVEGHVPAEDIKRLLAERPNVVGIAVPGMPVGTPGMESGDERESFSVFSFDEQGNTEVFNHYSF